MELEAVLEIVKAIAGKFGWGVAILLTLAASSGGGIYLVGKMVVDSFNGWLGRHENERAMLYERSQAASERIIEAATNGIKIQEGMLNRLGNLETGMGSVQGKLNDIHLDIRGLS